MWLDAVAVVLLGVFAGFGALRGALAGGLGLAGLALGYAAAVFAASHCGGPTAARLGIPSWAGMAAAGSGAFAVATLAVSLSASLLRRFHLLGGGRESSPRDRFFGALFGGLRGALVVVLLGTLAGWVDALRVTGVVPSLPAQGESMTALASARAVEAGVEAALSESPARRVVAQMVARPARSLAGFQQLIEHPRVGALREDAVFWTYVEHGSVDAAMNRMSFLSLAGDSELRGQLAELGLVQESEASDAAAFRGAAAQVLAEVGPRIHALKRDPEFQSLLADEQVLDLVAQGETLALLAHPRFRSAIARAASTAAE